MTAEAPAPRAGAARLAEYQKVVHPGITTPFPAPVDAPAFEVIEDVVQADDGGDGDVPGGGQPGSDKLVRQPLLGRPLSAERQAAVIGGV